jgi:hypothetical protein
MPAAAAFQVAKSMMSAAIPRAHPAPNVGLSLATDASDSHVGGFLQQLSGVKKLSGAGSCYSTFDRELLTAFRHHSLLPHNSTV